MEIIGACFHSCYLWKNSLINSCEIYHSLILGRSTKCEYFGTEKVQETMDGLVYRNTIEIDLSMVTVMC